MLSSPPWARRMEAIPLFSGRIFLIKRFCDLAFLIAESVYADSKLFKFHTGRFLRQKTCAPVPAIYNFGNRTYFSGNHGCPPSARPVYVSVWKINNPVPSALLKAAVCETDPLRSEEDLSVLLHRYLKRRSKLFHSSSGRFAV